MESFRFKVNLKGMIELLSDHLYSTPHVYIRELLQNAVDAITARQKVEPEFKGKIGIEVFSSSPKPTLYIEDNGIGLTLEEVHQFLSSIGHSSKRGEHEEDFIGRFGVGLLSCFIVSDEIVLITRSVRSSQALEWRGRPDGSYTIRMLENEMPPGTRIYIQCKDGFERWFEPQKVIELVRYYGEFLPVPIYFYGTEMFQINDGVPPWEMSPIEALVYGKNRFGENYLDVIPLSSPIGEAKGVAYILPHPVSVSAKKTHRVYLKKMLLSERVEKILPDWAFFVTAVLNVDRLRPTASREEFYEDAMLDLVRKELGQCIKQYLVDLAHKNPKLLQEIIGIHYMSIKLLAIEDDELFRLFIDWLPFETSLGMLKMGQIRKLSSQLYYTPTVDEFRQIAQVAKAQNLCVINGGYVHDTELVRKLGQVFPGILVRKLDPEALMQNFVPLTPKEQVQVREFMHMANQVLKPYQVICEIRKFEPIELPALFTTSEEAMYLRSAEYTREQANELFASLIQQLTASQVGQEQSRLCFNFNNPIVRKAIFAQDVELKKASIGMLYVQALLLGHHPLRKQEMDLLNYGIGWLIDRGLGEGNS